jgi:G3E family GTPase
VSLTHGCMCCSLRQDLLKAFGEIDLRAKQRGRPVDTIIIETTGVADPAPLALTFVTNPWVAARFKLDSIIW